MSMTDVRIGDARYRIVTSEQDGHWVAHAEHDDTGNQFGIEATGSSDSEVIARLTRWLEWQNRHAAALELLQSAENAYHRTIAGSAFVSPTEGPSALELQRESLAALEAARVRLDEIRSQKPD
jgi:hypothetical protein